MLIVRPASAAKSQLHFGGKGVMVNDVLKVLREASPQSTGLPSSSSSNNKVGSKMDSNPLLKSAANTASNAIAASVINNTPLLNGHLLEVGAIH